MGENLDGSLGQKRAQQHGEHAAGFDEVIEHFVEARGLRGVFGEFEGRGLIHVLIGAVHEGPDGMQRGLEFIGAEVGDGGVEVAGGPHDAGVDEQAEEPELVFLAVSVLLAEFASLPVEDFAGEPVRDSWTVSWVLIARR